MVGYEQLRRADPRQDVDRLRCAVERLFAGKAEYAAFCRTLPLNRFFANDKIRISSNLTELIKALEEYPQGDRHHVEAFARNTHNISLMQHARENPDLFGWARSFWNRNLLLAPCIYG